MSERRSTEAVTPRRPTSNDSSEQRPGEDAKKSQRRKTQDESPRKSNDSTAQRPGKDAKKSQRRKTQDVNPRTTNDNTAQTSEKNTKKSQNRQTRDGTPLRSNDSPKETPTKNAKKSGKRTKGATPAKATKKLQNKRTRENNDSPDETPAKNTKKSRNGKTPDETPCTFHSSLHKAVDFPLQTPVKTAGTSQDKGKSTTPQKPHDIPEQTPIKDADTSLNKGNDATSDRPKEIPGQTPTQNSEETICSADVHLSVPLQSPQDDIISTLPSTVPTTQYTGSSAAVLIQQSKKQLNDMDRVSDIHILATTCSMIAFTVVFNIRSLHKFPYPAVGHLLKWHPAQATSRWWKYDVFVAMFLWGWMCYRKVILLVLWKRVNSHLSSQRSLAASTAIDKKNSPICCRNKHFDTVFAVFIVVHETFLSLWMASACNRHLGFVPSDLEYAVPGLVIFFAAEMGLVVSHGCIMYRRKQILSPLYTDGMELMSNVGFVVFVFTLPACVLVSTKFLSILCKLAYRCIMRKRRFNQYIAPNESNRSTLTTD